MSKTKVSIPRFNGKAEFWFNEERNIVVIRDAKFHCWVLRMDMYLQRGWEFIPFKKQWTFDEFYDGSKYLVDKGFSLLERLD